MSEKKFEFWKDEELLKAVKFAFNQGQFGQLNEGRKHAWLLVLGIDPANQKSAAKRFYETTLRNHFEAN